MTKALAQTYTTIHAYRVFIMRALCIGCLVATVWYGVNVYQAISRTIAAENVSGLASGVSDSVNQLGAQYIQLADLASPSALSAHGMTVSSSTIYISSGASSLGSVAFLGHEF
jgi:hypothetical protein